MLNTLPTRIQNPRWKPGRTKNQFQDQDLVRTRSRTKARTQVQDQNQDQDLVQETFFEITEFDIKWVHMARYMLIFRQGGAIWLRIISKPLLTQK